MKRMITFLLFAAALLLGACSAQTESTPAQGVRFTDALEREVTVHSARRVAVLIGSFADVWCLAGGRETMVATANDAWTEFDLDLPEEVVNIGSVKEPNLELILAAEPDFIIASANTGADVALLETFEQLEIPVAYFRVSTFEEYLNMLDICTRITGETERYATYGEAIRERVDAALARADGSAPTALYLRASASGVKVKNSVNSVLGEMLKDLGAVNIADSDKTLLETLSMESIIAADPDFIFVVLQGSDEDAVRQVFEEWMVSDPAWSGLSAVRRDAVYVMDSRLFNLKPNARWGEAYEILADILYPDA